MSVVMTARPRLHQAIARRMSRRVFRKTLRSTLSRLLTPVEGEEDVLQVGLVAVECEHVVAGERLDQRIGFALEREQHRAAVPGELPHAGDVVEGGRRRRGGEAGL